MFTNTGDWLADQMKGALGNLWDWLIHLIFGWVPWPVWAVLALLILAYVYSKIGWQGMLIVAGGIWSFFVLRWGVRIGMGVSKAPVPVETMWPQKMPPAPAPKPPKKKPRTLQDLFTRNSG